MRVAALHVAHEVRDGVGGGGFEDPVAMVVEEAPAVDGDLVEGGVFADEVEGFGGVLGVAVDPLALVAALGDGVELLGAEVTIGSHGVTRARRWPKSGGCRFNDLAGRLPWIVSNRDEVKVSKWDDVPIWSPAEVTDTSGLYEARCLPHRCVICRTDSSFRCRQHVNSREGTVALLQREIIQMGWQLLPGTAPVQLDV